MTKTVETQTPKTRETLVEERFAKNIAEHQMTVLLDQGLYRHLRFQKPGTSTYYFDIITSPHLLTINGDMGTHVFSRLEDMFEFFGEKNGINPQYWGEKLVAQNGYKQYSPGRVKQYINDAFEENSSEYDTETRAQIKAAINEEILGWSLEDEYQTREALDRFNHKGYRFYDAWEWDLEEYTTHYLWNLFAIVYGIKEYRKVKTAAATLAPAGN